MNLTPTRPGAKRVYFVKGRAGYLLHRNGGTPHFVGSPYLAPRFTLAQAEKLAKLCTEAGHPADVSVV